MSHHHCLFLQVMDSRSAPTWEQERCAPIRACGAEDGGGARGPSTVKGERHLVQKIWTNEAFSLPPHIGPGDVPKGASPGLGGGAN